MVLLDTDIIIDSLRGKNDIAKKLTNMHNSNIEISTTAINAFELHKGESELSENSKKGAVDTFLNSISIMDFNRDSSRKAAEIFNHLKSKGDMIELTDIMIASIAISNNQHLITRNTKHFQRIPGLVIKEI